MDAEEMVEVIIVVSAVEDGDTVNLIVVVFEISSITILIAIA